MVDGGVQRVRWCMVHLWEKGSVIVVCDTYSTYFPGPEYYGRYSLSTEMYVKSLARSVRVRVLHTCHFPHQDGDDALRRPVGFGDPIPPIIPDDYDDYYDDYFRR